MQFTRSAALAITLLISTSIPTAFGQSAGSARNAVVYVPGLMSGPGSFGPVGFRRLCDLRVTGLVEWRVSWIERVVSPANEQKAALANLQIASAEAKQLVLAACKNTRPSTAIEELEVVNGRLNAVAQAFTIVRAAFEAFYATLDKRQQMKIDGLGPQRHGWRW
jgi:hypothetical protein